MVIYDEIVQSSKVVIENIEGQPKLFINDVDITPIVCGFILRSKIERLPSITVKLAGNIELDIGVIVELIKLRKRHELR